MPLYSVSYEISLDVMVEFIAENDEQAEEYAEDIGYATLMATSEPTPQAIGAADPIWKGVVIDTGYDGPGSHDIVSGPDYIYDE